MVVEIMPACRERVLIVAHSGKQWLHSRDGVTHRPRGFTGHTRQRVMAADPLRGLLGPGLQARLTRQLNSPACTAMVNFGQNTGLEVLSGIFLGIRVC